jgi:hypothetical protein
MVDTLEELPESEARSARGSRRSDLVALAFVLVIGGVLGYLGWILPSYGGSLVLPTLSVFATGAIIAVGFWVLASFLPQRRSLWLVSVGIGVLTAVASVWTFWFSLPASLTWHSDATQQAQRVLTGLRGEAIHGVVAHEPCADVAHGSIGSLRSPYRRCAVYTNQGHFVEYTPATSTSRGIEYTDRGAATFPDACSRHLVGKWWMFVVPGTGGCPFGYQFQGGG